MNAGLSGSALFLHFTTYGIDEGRAPSADDILTPASLLAYALANPDLQAAFGIASDATSLTSTQQDQLANQYYEFGYEENRPGDPIASGSDSGGGSSDGGGGGPIPGNTITLGTGPNDVTPNSLDPDLRTTDGNDTIDGRTEVLGSTLKPDDRIDGGAGNDTLNVTVDGSFTGFVNGYLKNVENVNITAVGLSHQTLSLSGVVEGVQNITVTKSADDVTISDLGKVTNLAVTNQTANVIFQGNTALTLTLTLDNVGASAAATTVTMDNTVTTLNLITNNVNVTTVGTDNVSTLNIEATGANTLPLPLLTNAKTLTVTKDGSVNLTTALTVLTKLDAAANSGGVTATVGNSAKDVTGGTGDDSITYTHGIDSKTVVDLRAGNDTLIISASKIVGSSVSIDGGDGTDTLVIETAADYNSLTTAGNTTKNFEALSIIDVLPYSGSPGVTIDAAAIGDVTSFQIVGIPNIGKATVTGLKYDATVTIQGDLALGNGLGAGRGNIGRLYVDGVKQDPSGTTAINLIANHTADLSGVGIIDAAASFGGLAGVKTINLHATATDTNTSSVFSGIVSMDLGFDEGAKNL